MLQASMFMQFSLIWASVNNDETGEYLKSELQWIQMESEQQQQQQQQQQQEEEVLINWDED